MAISEDNRPVPPGSPLSASALTELYLRPSRYFAAPAWLTRMPEVIAIGWIAGITNVMDRLDTMMLKAEIGSASSSQMLTTWLSGSWSRYWLFVLAAGAFNGYIFWYLGGWWYRKRLNWSGAAQVQPEHARAVYGYQGLVVSAPIILVTLTQSLSYSNYLEAWQSDEVWSSITLIFIVWSCVTSYKAANAGFPVTRWKARLWFLILPIVVYVAVLGVLGTLYALIATDS